jgi:hypothetical protein
MKDFRLTSGVTNFKATPVVKATLPAGARQFFLTHLVALIEY